MITLDIFGSGPNKKLDEAVGLDRSKVPNYPNDPATIQHRIDTAKAILSDPKSDPDSRQAAAAILAKHKDIKEYGDTARGQKMLTKVQKRAVDRMIKADDKRDAKAAKKNQDTANRAWDRMTDKDVAEGLAKQFEIIYREQNGNRKRKIVSGTSKEAVARQFKKQYKLEIEQVKQLQQGVVEGVEIIDQDYDMDQQIFKINVDGKTLQFTYWDYDENWANPDIKEIYAQVQDRLTGLSPQQQKAVAKAVYRAVKQDAIKEDAAGVQSNIDTSSPNFNHLLYMLRNDYPVPRGRLINKVMMNGQWLDPDEIKELVKSNQLWKGLGYGQEGYNVRGQGPGEKVYEQGVAKQPVNEISPHDYDSDEDYYAAMKRTPRVPRGRSADDYDDYIDEPQDRGDDESYY